MSRSHLHFAEESVGTADTGQFDVTQMIAVEIEYPDDGPGILHVLRNGLAANQADGFQDVFRFRDDLSPVVAPRVLRVDHDQAISRGAVVGPEIQVVANAADQRVIVVKALR